MIQAPSGRSTGNGQRLYPFKVNIGNVWTIIKRRITTPNRILYTLYLKETKRNWSLLFRFSSQKAQAVFQHSKTRFSEFLKRTSVLIKHYLYKTTCLLPNLNFLRRTERSLFRPQHQKIQKHFQVLFRFHFQVDFFFRKIFAGTLR